MSYVSRPTTPTPQMLTVSQVATTLGVSPRKVWRLIATNTLRSVRVGARGTRIPERALAEFVASLPAAR